MTFKNLSGPEINGAQRFFFYLKYVQTALYVKKSKKLSNVKLLHYSSSIFSSTDLIANGSTFVDLNFLAGTPSLNSSFISTKVFPEVSGRSMTAHANVAKQKPPQKNPDLAPQFHFSEFS